MCYCMECFLIKSGDKAEVDSCWSIIVMMCPVSCVLVYSAVLWSKVILVLLSASLYMRKFKRHLAKVFL